VGSISPSKFAERFEWLRRRNDSYFTIVIENDHGRIVGVGSLLIEAKFIHSCALAGHIEDIAVAKSEQGKKLGIKIIHCLMDISERVGCYKTTLVCADHNVPFYEKCGFVKGQNEMVRSSPPSPTCVWIVLTGCRKFTSTRRSRKSRPAFESAFKSLKLDFKAVVWGENIEAFVPRRGDLHCWDIENLQ
jgi:glucosamine-phosphate N-acetyltransferase